MTFLFCPMGGANRVGQGVWQYPCLCPRAESTLFWQVEVKKSHRENHDPEAVLAWLLGSGREGIVEDKGGFVGGN